jgi:hypothetical protein
MRFHDYAIVVFDEEIDEMGNYVADLLRRGAGVRSARRASLALEVDAEPCGTTRINISRKPNTNSSRITGNSDRTAATFTQSLIGGMQAIDHEAETLLTKKTHHHKICLAPARPRARQSRSLK